MQVHVLSVATFLFSYSLFEHLTTEWNVIENAVKKSNKRTETTTTNNNNNWECVGGSAAWNISCAKKSVNNNNLCILNTNCF